MRGEQSVLTRGKTPRVGSPPLARGTVYRTSPPRARGGITPACAGNSATVSVQPHFGQDHPRLRGEQLTRAGRVVREMGSPPLARGTARRYAHGVLLPGITPACAGNRVPTCAHQIGDGDHPRLRGEQLAPSSLKTLAMGSPPLARGTDKNNPRKNDKAGITPACAGNSSRQLPFLCSCGDHPRLRGEQFAWYLAVWVMAGSPPLARGTAIS